MRVVVTRPLASGRRTAERLAAMGHEPVLFPLTEARHLPEAAGRALTLAHWAMAATSAEAVRALMKLGSELSRYSGEQFFAVGDATAEAARQAGFRSVHVGPGTGDALADVIAGHSFGGNGSPPLLYLAGKPRSPALEDGLRRHGIPFIAAVCYEMIPADAGDAGLVLDPPADAVLLYSRKNAELFFELGGVRQNAPLFAQMAICCMSQNVAEAVPSPFRRNIRIAEAPNETGLLALLGRPE
jgi:uroporphyrinogen-III synthase